MINIEMARKTLDQTRSFISGRADATADSVRLAITNASNILPDLIAAAERLETVERQAAAMRERLIAIKEVAPLIDDDDEHQTKAIDEVLAGNAGKDFVSISDRDAAIETAVKYAEEKVSEKVSMIAAEHNARLRAEHELAALRGSLKEANDRADHYQRALIKIHTGAVDDTAARTAEFALNGIKPGTQSVAEENIRLRNALSKVATNIGNGSAASPEASLGFLCDSVPEEVRLVCGHYRSEIRSKFPDIGADPLKVRDAIDAIEAARNRLTQSMTVQQRGVPDQTALVWRIDIDRLMADYIHQKSGRTFFLKCYKEAASEASENLRSLIHTAIVLHAASELLGIAKQRVPKDDWAKWEPAIRGVEESMTGFDAIRKFLQPTISLIARARNSLNQDGQGGPALAWYNDAARETERLEKFCKPD